MISAKGMRMMLGANRIKGCYNATFKGTAQELDGTDGSTNGFDFPETGVRGGTFSGKAFYRIADGAWTPVSEGTAVSDIALFVTADTTDPAVEAADGVVTEFEITAEVKGRIEFNFTIKTQGAYTYSEVAL